MLKLKITKHGMAKYSSCALLVDPQVPLLFHSLKKLLAVIIRHWLLSKASNGYNRCNQRIEAPMSHISLKFVISLK